ncbi:hypothetical protein BH11ACT4_BH11ACT4_10470 [soil metagenome]
MSDLSLRLPNSRLRAVLYLGEKRAAAVALPARFAEPELFADWDQDEGLGSLFVGFEDGEMHLESRGGSVESHFHDTDGNETANSPWPAADTAVLTQWASLLLGDFHALLPGLFDDITEAAEWHEAGFDLYVCEVEDPVQLDLLEIEVEGELMTLPWLGAGTVSNDHVEGEGHRVALFWGEGDSEPDLPIAEAWLGEDPDEPLTKGVPGIDWTRIGLPEDEVLDWLKSIYLNHHVIPAAEGTLLDAVLRRLGGLDDSAH